MAFKFVVFAAFVAVAQAGYIAQPALAYSAAPVANHIAYAAPVAKAIVAEQAAPAHYDYGYSVSDPHTGDQKSQQESRRGDVVQGSYSLVDSDGTKRTVEYTADPHHGFNAVVHKEPAAVPVVAKVAAPVTYAAPAPLVAKYAAAPVVAKYAAPAISYAAAPAAVSYAAPAHLSYAAPAAPAHLSYAAPSAHLSYSAAPAYAYAAPSYYHH